MAANDRIVGDAAHLARALLLAERGRGTTSPNPMVGCVITNGADRVGEGWHERAGGPHAEVMALEAAGDRAEGGTAYVTLEPCDHHGRTPPCSSALVRAGVRRVVYGMADVDPVAAGGSRTLAAAGVEVAEHPLGAFAARQNRVFVTTVRRQRPHVTLKLAQTPDGALVPSTGRWITGPAARRHVHRLRARVDAVLVGVGTVLSDDPRLDVRHGPAPPRQPRAIVLDSTGRTPPDARVVRPGTLMLTTDRAGAAWRAEVARSGAESVAVAGDATGRVALAAALGVLFQRGIRSVLAEPGATLAEALARAELIDRCVLHTGSGRPRRITPCVDVLAREGWWTEMDRPLGGGDRETVLTAEERI